MKHILSLVLALSLVGCASETLIDLNQYTLKDLIFAPYFRLQIAPTFEHPVEFELSREEPYRLYYSEYEGDGGYIWGERSKILEIDLSEEQYKKIEADAKEYLKSHPASDDVQGYDGTFVVVETSIFHYTKMAIWSPDYKTNERGYSKLVKLCNYLSQIVEAQQNETRNK